MGKCALVHVDNVWPTNIAWRPSLVHQSFEAVTRIPAFSISLFLHTFKLMEKTDFSWAAFSIVEQLRLFCQAVTRTATGDINILGKATIFSLISQPIKLKRNGQQ